jgi:DnaJ-class molecular chaperone
MKQTFQGGIMENIESSIKEINKAIKNIDNEILVLDEERKILKASKEVLYKTNNVCPDCDGKGYYYRQSSGGDPYERSSDLKESCNRCSGKGKYNY